METEDNDFSKTPEPHVSTGSKIASLGKAAFHEAKRNAHLASLKAQIEKLRLVDLAKVQYALGKRAYELKIHPETFATNYSEIGAIEQNIATKRAGVTTADIATKMQKVKDVAVNTTMKAEAEALELKLKHRLVALGRDAEEFKECPELKDESDGVQSVNSRISDLEKEYGALSVDHAAQQQLKSLSGSLAKDAGEKSRELWAEGMNVFRHFDSNRTKALVLIICMTVLLISVVYISKPLLGYLSVFRANQEPNKHIASEQVAITPSIGVSEATPTSTEATPAPTVSTSSPKETTVQQEQATLDVLEKERVKLAKDFIGTGYDLIIKQKLDPSKFGFPASYQNRLYQAVTYYEDMHGDTQPVDPVLLVTTTSTFMSGGKTFVYATKGEEVEVVMDNGFSKKLPVLIEDPPDPRNKRLDEIVKQMIEIQKDINAKQIIEDLNR